MSPTAHFSQQLEKWTKEPFETHGFCTSFPVSKSYILTPTEAGNRLPPTHAAAAWAVEETFSSTVGNGSPQRQTHHPLHRSGSGSVAESIPFTAHNKQGSCPPKGNPKTIGFFRKPPKRHLWRMQRGGFEEVSRFSRHNVAGNRLTRR